MAHSTLRRISWALTAIGAINWGLVSLANFDLVETLFGSGTFMSRLVYGLVGLAGLYSAFGLYRRMTRPKTVMHEIARRFAPAA